MKILLIDKVPYFLTFLFAIVTFQLNQIVSYVINTPVITYQYKILSNRDSANVRIEDLELHLENLNRKTIFKNLVFDLKYNTIFKDEAQKIYNPELIPVAPAALLPDSLVKTWQMKINRYRIPVLNPGGEYYLRLSVEHDNKIDHFPNVYLSTSDAIWLTESNLETYIVKYQLQINLILLGILFAVTSIYILYIAKSQ